jgi:hypothetical protein
MARHTRRMKMVNRLLTKFTCADDHDSRHIHVIESAHLERTYTRVGIIASERGDTCTASKRRTFHEREKFVQEALLRSHTTLLHSRHPGKLQAHKNFMRSKLKITHVIVTPSCREHDIHLFSRLGQGGQAMRPLRALISRCDLTEANPIYGAAHMSNPSVANSQRYARACNKNW